MRTEMAMTTSSPTQNSWAEPRITVRLKIMLERHIGFRWQLRRVMAAHNLWKSTELRPLLRSRGINLSDAQVFGEPQRIPSRTFAARCDIFDCPPNDLFEPYVEMQGAASANAPHRRDLWITPGKPVAQRVRLITAGHPGRLNAGAFLMS